jgi:predicted anti-sigma-YlaC factor YlaD
MDCGKLEKNVLALCEGALPQEGKEALEEHLRECKRCASLTTDMRQLWGEMSLAEEAALSQQFWPRLFRRIREYDAGEREGLGRCAVANVGLRPIAAVAGLLLAVWAGIHLGEAYSVRVSTSVAETRPDAEEAVVPYLAVLDNVPHGSLAELLVQESILDGSEQ